MSHVHERHPLVRLSFSGFRHIHSNVDRSWLESNQHPSERSRSAFAPSTNCCCRRRAGESVRSAFPQCSQSNVKLDLGTAVPTEKRQLKSEAKDFRELQDWAGAKSVRFAFIVLPAVHGTGRSLFAI